MITRCLPALFLLLFMPAWESASAGSVRLELPELLGELRFDGTESPFGGGPNSKSTSVYSPIRHVYAVSEARLILEGEVMVGAARGDGVVRESRAFDLLPAVKVDISTTRGGSTSLLAEPTPDDFRIEKVSFSPFIPLVIPLPGPGSTPFDPGPIKYKVFLGAHTSNLPPRVTNDPVIFPDGIVVEEPITARITRAYVVFSGSQIVPEPSGVAIFVIGMTTLSTVARHRRMAA